MVDLTTLLPYELNQHFVMYDFKDKKLDKIFKTWDDKEAKEFYEKFPLMSSNEYLKAPRIHINRKEIIAAQFNNVSQLLNGIEFLTKHGVLETKTTPTLDQANLFDAK